MMRYLVVIASFMNSLIIISILPILIVLKAAMKVGIKKAFLEFFKKPTIKAFDETLFLKKQGLNFKSNFLHNKFTGTKIHYMECGDENSPLMICLHGFPECWYSWKHVMKAFEYKYRVVAIDMRGYNKSDKPRDVSSYHMHHLVNDVREVIEGLGFTQATVVGHDWGGLVAWNFARFCPDHTRELIVLNAPFEEAFDEFLSEYWWQRWTRFWYMSAFFLPTAATFLFTRYDYNFIKDAFSSRETGIINSDNRLSDDEIIYFKHACGKNIYYPICFYTARNPYYNGIGLKKKNTKVLKPTLVVWGKKDSILDHRMISKFKKHVPNLKVNMIENASHWVALDQPNEVIKAMTDFLDDRQSC